MNDLPEVGGRRMLRAHDEFERACKIHLMDEQEKISPDNSLVALLCDAVRLSREFCDYATVSKFIGAQDGAGWEGGK